MASKRVKLIGLIGVMALAIVVGSSCRPAAPEGGKMQYYSMGTSALGGTNHIIGAAFASLINRDVPGVKVAAELTAGSADNLRLLETNKVQFALTNAELSFQAYNGIEPFKTANKNLRAILSGYQFYTHLYTLANSGINKFEDLKGKKIGVGAVGAWPNSAAGRVLEEYGLKMGQDWTPEYLGYAEQAEAVGNSHINAAMHGSSLPIPALLSLTASRAVRILSFDEQHLNSLLSKYKFWTKSNIPANTYTGVNYPVLTFSGYDILVVDASVPDDVVYRITKVIGENTAELTKMYKEAGSYTLDKATRIQGIVPFHPGAQKYLKEKGIL